MNAYATDPKCHAMPCYSLLCRLIRRCLVREPSERATLEDILADPWLTPSPGPSLFPSAEFDAAAGKQKQTHAGAPQLTAQRSVAECTHALVTQLQLSRSEFETLLRQMEEGGVAPRDEVLSALEQDRYDYLTATFFLLAERHLRDRERSNALRTRTDEASLALPPATQPASTSASTQLTAAPARPLALQGHISPAPKTRRVPHQQSSTATGAGPLRSPLKSPESSVLSPRSPPVSPKPKPLAAPAPGRDYRSPSHEALPPLPLACGPPSTLAARPDASQSNPSPQLQLKASRSRERDREDSSDAASAGSAQRTHNSNSNSPALPPFGMQNQCRALIDASNSGLSVKRYEGPRRGSWAPLSQQQQQQQLQYQQQRQVIPKLGARSISRTSITSLVLPDGLLSPSGTLPFIGEREQSLSPSPSPSSLPKSSATATAAATRAQAHPVHVLNRESSGFSVRSTHSDSSRKSSSSVKPPRSAVELLVAEHHKLASSRQAFSMDKASASAAGVSGSDEGNKCIAASSTPLLLHASTIGTVRVYFGQTSDIL